MKSKKKQILSFKLLIKQSTIYRIYAILNNIIIFTYNNIFVYNNNYINDYKFLYKTEEEQIFIKEGFKNHNTRNDYILMFHNSDEYISIMKITSRYKSPQYNAFYYYNKKKYINNYFSISEDSDYEII